MVDDLDGILKMLRRQREGLEKEAARAATNSSADELLEKLRELRHRAAVLIRTADSAEKKRDST